MVPGGIAAFVLASILIELTPGPNMTWLAIVAASQGRARGFAAVAGVATGLAVIGAAAAAGLGAAIAASPTLFEALRWGGAAFLLWLAWDAWREAGEVERVGPAKGLVVYFRRGFVVNALNPKAAAFYVAVLPGFIDPAGSVTGQAVFLTAIYVAVATAIHAGIVIGAGSLARMADAPGRMKTIRRVLALALAGVAIWFLIGTAR
jgi:threonine/homoserine/homoserine lactone efflux protein